MIILSRHARSLAAGLLAVLSINLMGCPMPPAPCPDQMLTRTELVQQFNRNASAVPRLWARATIDLHVKTDDHSVSWGSLLLPPNGLLFLSKTTNRLGAQNFVLLGRELGSEIFRVGVCAMGDPRDANDLYYCWYRFGDSSAALYGRNGSAGLADTLPLDAHDLLSVLGIMELPEAFAETPTVTLTTDPTPGHCAYILSYLDRQRSLAAPGGAEGDDSATGPLIQRREMHFAWAKDAPARPFLIHFYDRHGRRVMTAHLKNYKPVAVEDMPEPAGGPPVVATDIEIEWPQKDSRIHILLSDMTTKEKVIVPDSFEFRLNLPQGFPPGRIVNVDERPSLEGGTR